MSFRKKHVPNALDSLEINDIRNQVLLNFPNEKLLFIKKLRELNQDWKSYANKMILEEVNKIKANYHFEGKSNKEVLATFKELISQAARTHYLPFFWVICKKDYLNTMRDVIVFELCTRKRRDRNFIELIKPHLQLCNFANIKAANIDLTNANVQGGDFSNAFMPGSMWNKCNDKGADFTNTDLQHASYEIGQFQNSKSIIGAKFDFLDNRDHLESEKIKPIKMILVKQYQQLINESHDIKSLVSLFSQGMKNEILRIKQNRFGAIKKIEISDPGETTSCQQVMKAAIMRLVTVVSELQVRLDNQTIKVLLSLYDIMNPYPINSILTTFNPDNDLKSAVMKNQLLPELLPSKKHGNIR